MPDDVVIKWCNAQTRQWQGGKKSKSGLPCPDHRVHDVRVRVQPREDGLQPVVAEDTHGVVREAEVHLADERRKWGQRSTCLNYSTYVYLKNVLAPKVSDTLALPPSVMSKWSGLRGAAPVPSPAAEKTSALPCR